MTIAEKIKRISDKANISYSIMSNIINSSYSKAIISVEQKLKLFEEIYGI